MKASCCSFEGLFGDFDGFRFGDSAASAFMAISADVSDWIISLGAAGEVSEGKFGRGVAAATAEHVLDANRVDVGGGHESLYDGGGSPRSHAQAAQLV